MVARGKTPSSLAFLLIAFLGSLAVAQAQQPQNVMASAEERSKAEINVLTDCGARGDGTSDDSLVLQQCINAHPGKTIAFPRTRNKGTCDYELSQTLSVNASSTALVGVGGTTFNNTVLCWNTDVTGIGLSGGAGQAVRNLNLRGNSYFNAADTSTYPVGTSDGVRVNAGQASLRDVFVISFSRHGVNVDSTHGGEADLWLFDNVRVDHNRGDGFHFIGLDANGGLCLMCYARFNQGWGFFNHAVIPSTYVAPITDSNHNDPTKPERTVPIRRITVTNGVATVTTTAPHQTIAGDWGVFLECPNFPIKAAVLSVPGPTTLQVATNLPDGVYCDTGSATYGFKAGARIWALGRTVNDATIKAGSNFVTSVLAHWTANDYGTLVCIEQAGLDGKEFCSTVKFISGNSAMLVDTASRNVLGGRARIVTNGGPYNAGNSTFVQSYSEGNQEGNSQFIGSLTLGADLGNGRKSRNRQLHPSEWLRFTGQVRAGGR